MLLMTTLPPSLLLVIPLVILGLIIIGVLLWRSLPRREKTANKPKTTPVETVEAARGTNSPGHPAKVSDTERIFCSKCQSSNRPGARFCAVCGQDINEQSPKSTKKLFKNRPVQSIFGGQFVSGEQIFNSEQQYGYTVKQLTPEASLKIRQCPNPACGALLVSNGKEIETICTECQTALTVDLPLLEIFETPNPIWTHLQSVAEKRLTHGFVRAPIMVFQDGYAGETRECLVLPHTDPLPAQIEQQQVQKNWALGLADALGYLHKNGLTFNGQLGAHNFQQSNGRAVFANFANLRVSSDPQARKADLCALAQQLYQWLTGQTNYAANVALSPMLNQFFETALTEPGFSEATALIQALETALAPQPATQNLDFRLGCRTHTGMIRELNEDSILTIHLNKYLASISSPLGIYVVADGMGGHAAGEVASGTIVNILAQKAGMRIASERLNSEGYRQWIIEAVQEANSSVFERGKKMGGDMGSTVVVALLEGTHAHLGHVGDSRVYRINTQGITPLTTDHSLVERLMATGQITADEAKIHPQRNVIYRTIGDKPTVEVETATHELQPEDRILLCSDGLSGMVDDEIMRQIVMKPGITPQQACDQLIAAANHAGGEDNITVVLIEIEAA